MWISPPHVNPPHVKYHTLHTWIIWESTQESYTFYTLIILESWIGITCFKTLTCGSCSHVEETLIWVPYTPVCLPYNSHVATIQGHCCVTAMQPVWLPCNYYVAPCNSWVATRFCVATIQLPCDYHTTPMWLPYNSHVVHHNLWIDLCMLITVYGSCTLITVYGSHIWIPQVVHTGFSTCFHICFPTCHTRESFGNLLGNLIHFTHKSHESYWNSG